MRQRGRSTTLIRFLDMEVRRNYTVALDKLISSSYKINGIGKHLHLMIKSYSDGALTPLLNALKKGDTVSLSDCTGNFQRYQLENKKKVFLIAAGTGFTPMIRLINYYFTDDQNKDCAVSLLVANKQEKDILWKNQLDTLASEHEERFKVMYMLSEPSTTWNGLKGRIDKDIVQSFLSTLSSTVLIQEEESTSSTPVLVDIAGDDGYLYAICGPDKFTQAINTILLDLGIKKESIHCFLG